jgi:hypothetical protein
MIFREATINDLPKIVEMIADDALGKTREEYRIPIPEAYSKAFEDTKTDR